MEAAEQYSSSVGTQPACLILGVSRASVYRRRQARANPQPIKQRLPGGRALNREQQQEVLEMLHAERFRDQAPASIYATLLDEGTYLCSIRSMYRILERHEEVRERRNQLSHPQHSKPELLATGPNELWSWDITKLKGPVKWTYFYLYVILDVFSRYVVGWMVAHRESAALAKKLIATSCTNQNIIEGQLTVHADRGTSMTSKPVALLLSDLGINKTHSRPHTSNDNPYSESQFKTLKYRPEFPKRFGSIEDAVDAVAAYNPTRARSGASAGLMRNLRRRSDGRLYWHWDPRIMELKPETHHAEVQGAAREVGRRAVVPIMLVRGLASDVVSDAGVLKFKALVPSLEVSDVRQAGHMVAGDNNDSFVSAIMDFLKRCLPLESGS